MEGQSPTNRSDIVNCDDARNELERLLTDSRFHITDRNRAFLRYIADETFRGQSRGVKAYSIALDVFGRPSNFDPNTDPIVRIEAARLRAALDQYYEAYGEPEGVRITLPRGNYIAEFSHIPADAGLMVGDHLPNQPPYALGLHSTASQRQASPLRRQGDFLLGATVVIVAICVGGWAMLKEDGKLTASTAILVTGKPLVTITTSTRDPADREKVDDLDEILLIALSRFGTLQFRINQTDSSDEFQATRGLAPQVQGAASPYQIALKYNLGKSPSATWQITDPQSGVTLASGKETVDDPDVSPDEVGQALVTALAIRFGSNFGVVNSIERDKAYPASAEGNVCILRGEYAINTYDGSQIGLAHSCLQKTIAADDRAYEAKAVLARILVIEDEWHGTKANLPAATKLADEAAIGAPLSDRSQLARMYVQFASGQFDAAFATGRAVVARNPLNGDVASALALRLYFSGSDAEGAEIAGRVVRNIDPASRAANLVLAFDAYYHGDGLEALRRLGLIANEGTPARYIRIASLVRLGKRDEAKAAFDASVRFNPHFASHMPNLFSTPHFNADMKAGIAHDIAIAKEWSNRKKLANCGKNDC